MDDYVGGAGTTELRFVAPELHHALLGWMIRNCHTSYPCTREVESFNPRVWVIDSDVRVRGLIEVSVGKRACRKAVGRY